MQIIRRWQSHHSWTLAFGHFVGSLQIWIFSDLETLFPKAHVNWLVEEITGCYRISGNSTHSSQMQGLKKKKLQMQIGIFSPGFRKQNSYCINPGPACCWAFGSVKSAIHFLLRKTSWMQLDNSLFGLLQG